MKIIEVSGKLLEGNVSSIASCFPCRDENHAPPSSSLASSGYEELKDKTSHSILSDLIDIQETREPRGLLRRPLVAYHPITIASWAKIMGVLTKSVEIGIDFTR